MYTAKNLVLDRGVHLKLLSFWTSANSLLGEVLVLVTVVYC